jgi:hypothetical protein
VCDGLPQAEARGHTLQPLRGQGKIGLKYPAKNGANALSAGLAANELQIPGEFPQLALLVESWPMNLAKNGDVVQQLFPPH